MTLDEKVSYINSLPADKRDSFVQNMSNDERNSFLKQLDTSDQLDIIASMADVGEAFGVNFWWMRSPTAQFPSAPMTQMATWWACPPFGNTVEATGIPYTVPVLIGGGAVVLAAAGLGIVPLPQQEIVRRRV